MLAAAYTAHKKGPIPDGPIPPPALIEAWKCQRWGSLPNPGGLRDQPVILMRDMTAADNVYDAIRSWRASKNWAHFQRDNPVKWRIVDAVLTRRRGVNAR